jgi:hypothetical protein
MAITSQFLDYMSLLEYFQHPSKVLKCRIITSFMLYRMAPVPGSNMQLSNVGQWIWRQLTLSWIRSWKKTARLQETEKETDKAHLQRILISTSFCLFVWVSLVICPRLASPSSCLSLQSVGCKSGPPCPAPFPVWWVLSDLHFFQEHWIKTIL